MGFNCVGFEACGVGLIRNNATGKCDDINECLTNPCPPKTDCINLIGGDPGYKCSDCPTGYEKDATGTSVFCMPSHRFLHRLCRQRYLLLTPVAQQVYVLISMSA